MTGAHGTDERGVAAVHILFALMLSALAAAPALWAVPLPGIATAGFLVLIKRRWRHQLLHGGVPRYRPLLLAGSRWLTRSLTPAIVVQGAFGAFGAAFMLPVAAS